MTDTAFGPWVSGLSTEEHAARWRCFSALVLLYCGGSHPLLRLSIAAEHDAEAERAALAAFDSLAPLQRRRLLSAYVSIAELLPS
jgi:hypothetical protein